MLTELVQALFPSDTTTVCGPWATLVNVWVNAELTIGVPPSSAYLNGDVAPAGRLTVIVPEGGPQAVFVAVAVGLKLPVKLTVIVSMLVSCTAGLSQAEKIVLTIY